MFKTELKKLNILLLGCLLVLSSCAKVVDKERLSLNKERSYAVVPFENYTDTPLAGYRVASALEGILRSKGFRVADRTWNYRDQDPDGRELKKILKEARKTADYVIMGSVNEFRYKVGIDGEPAVSVSVYILDSKSGKIVSGSALSATGLSYESLGTLTQKLLRTLME
ncbi:hypothetical protein [Hydrogenivirga sp.]